MPGSSYRKPFGEYIAKKIKTSRSTYLKKLYIKYKNMAQVKSLRAYVKAVCGLSTYIDSKLQIWPRVLGGRVTPFSTFRGFFLEEVTLGIAARSCGSTNGRLKCEVTKLSTGGGVITGIALAFRKGNIPDPLPLVFRRDREDVIVGIRRSLRIEGPNVQEEWILRDEIIPICIIACKIYIDATRLENVLAKAKNMYDQYSSCHFVVLAEWDALGEAWHDNRGKILDSLFAPVHEMVFLRGTKARRPNNNELKKKSLSYPYQPKEMNRLSKVIKRAIKEWMG
jgi:hypothetical protein